MSDSLRFEIPIVLELSDKSAANVNATVEQALSEAIAAAQHEYEVGAEPEVRGAFGGVGETVIVLTILHLLKAGGIAVAKGALTAAGAAFVNTYLLPKLRALNLIPGEPKEVPKGATPASPEAPTAQPVTDSIKPEAEKK
jgi:hypothetical protein